jgi:hypothetical protein
MLSGYRPARALSRKLGSPRSVPKIWIDRLVFEVSRNSRRAIAIEYAS